jgi:hypothetical protein
LDQDWSGAASAAVTVTFTCASAITASALTQPRLLAFNIGQTDHMRLLVGLDTRLFQLLLNFARDWRLVRARRRRRSAARLGNFWLAAEIDTRRQDNVKDGRRDRDADFSPRQRQQPQSGNVHCRHQDDRHPPAASSLEDRRCDEHDLPSRSPT